MQRWERTYWVVFVANLITAVGMMSFLPFFPAFLRELGVTDDALVKTWTGLVFGAAPLSAAVMGPIWGALGDRFGRKLMVLRALLAITLFVGCMGFVQTPLQLLLLRLGQGVFSGFVPPSITLVSVAAPKGVQGRIAGSLQAALASGSIAGPLLGAWVQDHLGIRSVFLFVAGASLLAAGLVALFAHEEDRLRATLEGFAPTSVLVGVGRDLKGLLANARIRAALWLLFAVQFGIGATTPQLLLFVEELGVAERLLEERTAWLTTALNGAALLSTAAWGRLSDRRGHARVLALSSAASALLLLAHGLARGYPSLFAARVLLGLFSTGSGAAAFALAAVESEDRARGGAMGAVFSARTLAMSLGSMGGGFLASWLGLRGLFWLSGVGVGVFLAILAARPPAAGNAGLPNRPE